MELAISFWRADLRIQNAPMPSLLANARFATHFDGSLVSST